MKSFIKIIDPGFHTSIQDNGRYGYRRLGFPVSGPMDKYSFTTANKLVGNFKDEAVLEKYLDVKHVIPCANGGSKWSNNSHL